MKLTRIILLIFFGFLMNIVYAQKLEVLQKLEIKNLPKAKKFAFIERDFDTTGIQYVATILAVDKNRKSIIEKLYFNIRERANEIGANC